MRKFLLSCILLIGCGDNDSRFDSATTTDFRFTEPTSSTGYENCGDHIEDPGEECDTESTSCVKCREPRMIFVNTSVGFTALDIGSKDLDQICTDSAISAGINTVKTWKAWISRNEMNIRDNIYNSPGLYVDRLGDIVAYSFVDLTDGSINIPIVYDQDGFEHLDKDVWTGTFPNGTTSYENCNNWTSNDIEAGVIGRTNTITSDWTYIDNYQLCSTRKYIYCIEDRYIK